MTRRKKCFFVANKTLFVGQTSKTVNLQGGGRSQKNSVENYCVSMPQQRAKQTQVLVCGTAWIHTHNNIWPTKGWMILTKSWAFLWALHLEKVVNMQTNVRRTDKFRNHLTLSWIVDGLDWFLHFLQGRSILVQRLKKEQERKLLKHPKWLQISRTHWNIIGLVNLKNLEHKKTNIWSVIRSMHIP